MKKIMSVAAIAGVVSLVVLFAREAIPNPMRTFYQNGDVTLSLNLEKVVDPKAVELQYKLEAAGWKVASPPRQAGEDMPPPAFSVYSGSSKVFRLFGICSGRYASRDVALYSTQEVLSVLQRMEKECGSRRAI